MQQAMGVAQIAKATGLTRQTVYRIKGDPAGAEAASGDVSVAGPLRIAVRMGEASRLAQCR